MNNLITLSLLFLATVSLISQDQSTLLENNDTLENITYLEPATALDGSLNLSSIEQNGQLQIFNSLQGRVSGLEINASSGSPGASMSAVLRGYNTILNSNHPLIVLDGMIIDNMEIGAVINGTDQTNRLIDINPFDIEKINIIKGGPGTAKYGIRGSNGIIELTSKRATESGFKINFSSSITVSKANKLLPLQQTYAQGRNNEYRGPETNEGSSWGPLISELSYDGDTNYPFDEQGQLIPSNGTNGAPAQAYDPYTFLQNGISRNLNLGVSNSTEKLSYRLSLGSNNTNGIIPTSDYNRNSIRGIIDYAPHSKLRFNAQVNQTWSEAQKTQKGSNLSGIMLGLTRTPPSFDNANGLSPSEALEDDSAYILDNGNQRSYRSGIYDNPYWSVNKNSHVQKVDRTIANVKATYNINDQFSFSGLTGYDTYHDNRQGGIDINPGRDNGSVFETKSTIRNYYNKIAVNSNLPIFKNINLTAELGYDFYVQKTASDALFGTNFLVADNLKISNALTVEGEILEESKATSGIYLVSALNFKEYLDFNFSLRRDVSSTLGSENNSLMSFGIETEINLKNIISRKESHSEIFNEFKLVLGLGRSGMDVAQFVNARKLKNAVISGDGFIGNHTFDNFFESNSIAINPNLAAEKTTGYEIGTNVSLLKNRFRMGLTYYSESSTGIINLRDLDPTTGFDSNYQNNFGITNKGIEIDLFFQVLNTKNIAWSLSNSFTKNKNNVESADFFEESIRIESLGAAISSNINIGDPYGVIIGTSFMRNENGQRLIDNQGYPMLSRTDQIIGDPNPDWIWSINSELRLFDKIYLSGLIEIKQGGDAWCGTCGVLDQFGRTELAASERNSIVVFEGVNSAGETNQIPVNLADPESSTSEYYRVRNGFNGVDEENIFDTSWIRLRQININYDMTHLLSGISFLGSVNVGLFATNLLLVTDFPGIDPETNLTGSNNSRGLEYFNNPNTKSFGLNLNITF